MNVADTLPQLPPWSAGIGMVVFVRHGEREDVASHEFPRHDAPLTEAGRRAARGLGELVGTRLGSLRSSPVPRCLETAKGLLDGSGADTAIAEDRLLGDPGAIVTDATLAMQSLTGLGFHQAARRLGEGEALPGFADPDQAASRFVTLADSLLLDRRPVVHMLVTHDLVLSTFVARLLGRPVLEDEWPGYLHGVVLWRGVEGLRLRYRQDELVVPNRLAAAILDS